MTNFALLNNVDHQDTRVITEPAAEYGDNVMFAMTFPGEFRDVQAWYPILFHRDQDDNYYPIALFGFQKRENLFLDESGWNAGYIPAMIRREPFMIGFQESRDGGGAEKARVLSVDMDHPRISADRGERLFQPLGGRTPYLEDMADLLEGIYLGLEHGKAFVAALEEHGLIESVTIDIMLKDESTNQLLGFYAINEEKVQDLPGDVLERFNKQGFLAPIFLAMASMSNMRRLIEVKNAELGD